MRQIKFRAWHKTGEAMMTDVKNVYTLNSVFTDDTLNFMQFTGVTDRKGVEIYEGDIIGSEDGDSNLLYISHHKIVWHDSGFMGKQICSNNSLTGIDYWTRGDKGYVVIGNIYQNPELLRGTTNGKD